MANAKISLFLKFVKTFNTVRWEKARSTTAINIQSDANPHFSIQIVLSTELPFTSDKFDKDRYFFSGQRQPIDLTPLFQTIL